MQSKTPRRGTLKQLGAYLRERGYPISDSVLEKRAMPSRGDGPPVAARFGKHRLFDFDAGEAWAERQLQSANPDKAA